MKSPAAALAILMLALAPETAAAQKPDTVFFEHLTFDEIRDSIRAGAKTVIVPTGGTEANGPHLTLGANNRIVAYAANEIARALGNTLVAPVIAYVPEGAWEPLAGPVLKPGTLSLPDDRGYSDLLEAAANSMKSSGFRNIIFIAESSGGQAGLKSVAEKLTMLWKSTGVRIFYIEDYYKKSQSDQAKFIREKLGIQSAEIGDTPAIISTSELMAINGSSIRLEGLEKDAAARSTPQLGLVLLRIKIDDAVSQVKQLLAQGEN